MAENASRFWADQLAEEIAGRKKFHYIEKNMPEFEKYVVKTSASISGVLHIGRLSDTIRGESVVRALLDHGKKAEFIWVAEDMDPLRKVPKGVPKSYSQYIGMPVTDIPDPTGTHKSYAELHTEKYFEVLEKFVSVPMKKYSTREEYKKGSFKPFIKKILENAGLVREIQNKYRREPLPADWSPWKPVCDNCGKIITTNVTGFENGRAIYKCEDYKFENNKAEGCGHEGANDPMKGNGKLVWKGEWAAEWALWKVSSEGAGKEYQVPNSAWWVNGEIVEKVLGFPMPVPIFYEHIMIDNEKMSASKGNIVYPADWLKVATPELLRFFYNKKLMKTRSFSWTDLPNMYDEYDKYEQVYFSMRKDENEKDTEHMKRLYEICQIHAPKKPPVQVPFDFAVAVAQVAGSQLDKKGIAILQRTGHVKKDISEDEEKYINERLVLARNWAELHAPERYRFELQEKPGVKAPEDIRPVIDEVSKSLESKKMNEQELVDLFFGACKKHGIKPKTFFQTMYRILINKDYGPRLAPFVLSIGQKKVAKLLAQA